MQESPKRQKADIVIGSSSGKVTYTDTSTEFGVNNSVVLKSDLAAVCKCGTDQSMTQPALSADRSVHLAGQRRGCEGGNSQYQSTDYTVQQRVGFEQIVWDQLSCNKEELMSVKQQLQCEAAATVSDGSHSAATTQRPSARAAVRPTAHYLTTTAGARRATAAVHTATPFRGTTDPGTTITTVRHICASSQSVSTL